jgi:hypothetical protein
MIVRRYGSRIQSVTPNFDSRAMTEIGFLRGNALTMTADELAERYRRTEQRELRASAQGGVQGEVEDAVLASLLEQLEQLEASAGEGALLLIENEPGVDHPKTHSRQMTTVSMGENRFVFEYTIDPPLRVAIYVPV